MIEPPVLSWLRRAREALSDARLLLDAGRLHAAVNRLYYACFYASTALLLSRGLTSSKHTGVRAVLHRDFVRAGAMPADLARIFDRLFDSRQVGDYEVLAEFNPDEVAAWMEGAERFVAWVEGLLSTAAEGTPT